MDDDEMDDDEDDDYEKTVATHQRTRALIFLVPDYH